MLTDSGKRATPNQAKKYGEIIERNTDRLINIVNDLLLLSSLEEKPALELEDIHLNVFLENVNKDIRPEAERQGTFFGDGCERESATN